MSGKVWLPGSSLVEEKAAEQLAQVGGGKEKPKKAKIVKRTTPTVDLRAPPSCRWSAGSKQYSTIERSSYNKNSVHLNLNAASEPAYRNAELCGWETEREKRIALCPSSSNFRRCVTAERNLLSTPADGYRSGVPSRACSRAGGGRRGDTVYQFKHLSDAQAYFEDYCAQCGYSAFSFSREGGEIIREVGKEVEISSQSGKTRGDIVSTRHPVTDGDRGNQLYLQQLAKRLGVCVINEKQVKYRPQPTPPSITKRNRVAADLLVTTQEERPSFQEDSTLNEKAISDEQARPVCARQSRPCTRATTETDSLELPRVLTRPRTRRNNSKTLSTSSVVKYLNITSRPHRTISLGLGEEESAVDGSSHGSLGDPPCLSDTPVDSTALEEAKSLKKDDSGTCSTEVKVLRRGCEPSPFDDAQRDRILTQKAHALGLLSRDRVRASLLQRINSQQNGTRTGDMSRPHTRAGVDHHTRNKTSRVSYRQQHSTVNHSHREERKDEHTELRPKTSREKTLQNSDKLDKMRAIYEPGSQARSHGRQLHKHRFGTVLSKRPSTRDGDGCQRERWKEMSRPGTKLGKKARVLAGRRPGMESEESQYWNEVPNTDCPRYQFHRPHPPADPHSIPAAAESNRVQRVRPCSITCKPSPQQPPLTVELSSHHYRHSNKHTTPPHSDQQNNKFQCYITPFISSEYDIVTTMYKHIMYV